MRKFLFVGEKRSNTAVARGWTWRDGRLAAKTLHEALRSINVDPTCEVQCDYVNLWSDGDRLMLARLAKRWPGRVVVSLGSKVGDELSRLGVAHVKVKHPAARGWIRGRGRYAAHVREVLGCEQVSS